MKRSLLNEEYFALRKVVCNMKCSLLKEEDFSLKRLICNMKRSQLNEEYSLLRSIFSYFSLRSINLYEEEYFVAITRGVVCFKKRNL